MRPCKNCKKLEHCEVVAFIKRNIKSSPWSIAQHIDSNHAVVEVVSLTSGDLESVVLDCGYYSPDKQEDDFSQLAKKYVSDYTPVRGDGKCGSGGCGGCNGGC
jgi:hypothetical protein